MKPAISIVYQFDFGDHEIRSEVKLDSGTLLQFDSGEVEFPDWVRLDNHQCPECLLSAQATPNCPVAVNLIPLLRQCGGFVSYTEAKITVTTQERAYIAQTTVQRGLSSLLGLMMATSDCPNMAFLRPMARFHLPFASDVETIYRAVTTYLMFQYYKNDACHPLYRVLFFSIMQALGFSQFRGDMSLASKAAPGREPPKQKQEYPIR